MSRRSHLKSSMIGWFVRRPVRGTVYLMQPRSRPDLFKIGFTTRRPNDRRRELERKADRGLHIVCAITMPHAYVLEQRLLRRMRGGWWLFRRKANRRGTEWFHHLPGERIEHIRRLMLWESDNVRRVAILKFSWPVLGEGRHVFEAPVRKRHAWWSRPMIGVPIPAEPR